VKSLHKRRHLFTAVSFLADRT